MPDGKERKLRSKEDGTSKVLFNFDKINRLITDNKRITIENDVTTTNMYRWYEDDAKIPEAAKTAKTVNLKLLNQLLPRRNKLKLDKLDPSVYEPFHKKMKKEEKNMTNSDRMKIMAEVDNLRTQLQLINQYDWIRHLPKITHINDLKNYDELVLKRELTIREISRLLKKFDDWKRRNDRLLQDIKDFEHGIDSDDEDERILRVPIEELQQQRMEQRIEKDGKTVVLNLRNGYGILAGPYLVPKIIEFGLLETPPPKSPPNGISQETVETRPKKQKTMDDFFTNGLKPKQQPITRHRDGRHQRKGFTDTKPGPTSSSSSILRIVNDDEAITSDPPIFTEITQPNLKIRGRPRIFTPIRVVLQNDSIHLGSDPEGNVAFGEPVPDLSPNSFDLALPNSWKAEKKRRKA